MRIVNRIKAWFRKKRAERKLKKSGYSTWEQYRRNRDPDINQYCTNLEDFYKGYQYIYAIKDYNHFAYTMLADYGPGGIIYGYDEIKEWLYEKIKWNYRVDIHRVWLNRDGNYVLNDIGGRDIIFYAFKYEKDLTYFLLRWA